MKLREYLGLPYVANGRAREGADCLGLALLRQRDYGREIPPPEGCSIEDPSVPETWFCAHWVRISASAARPGDVLVVEGRPRGVGTLERDERVLTTSPATGALLVPRRTFLRTPLVGVWRAR